jgi:hypothetical protein
MTSGGSSGDLDPVLAYQGEYSEFRADDGTIKLVRVGPLVPIRHSEREKLSAQFLYECEGSQTVQD